MDIVYNKSNCYKDATKDPATIKDWWQDHPSAMLGLPTGKTSGIFALDIDVKSGQPGLESLKKLEAEYGPLPETKRTRTASGGLHYLFRHPAGLNLGNTAGKLGTGLDTRGDGGYIIVPPSKSVAGEYRFENPGTPLADVPQWLVDLLPKRDSSQATPFESSKSSRSEVSPYVESALKGECGTVALAAKGNRNATLNAAAFALGQLVGGGELDRATVESRLLDAALRCGLPEAEARKTIQSGLSKGLLEPRISPKISRAVEVSATQSPNDFFIGEPIPFDDIEAPPLPVDSLPPVLSTFVSEVAEAIQVPPELVFINALSAMAVAAQGKIRVVVNSGYSEPLNLYSLAALPPGERKSAVVELCKKPLVEWERRAASQSTDSRKRAISERKSQERLVESRRAKLAGIKDRAALRAEMAEIADLEAGLPEVPPLPRLFADDVTPEALAVLMAGQHERIGVIEAEGGLFDILAGRYSNGIPNLDLVLKAWSGESTTIDRRRGDSIMLTSPHLTISISPQPDVIKTLADKPGFRGRGVLARFMYLLPKSRVGYRSIDAKPLPGHVAAAYAGKLEAVLAIRPVEQPEGITVPHSIRLSSDAERLRRAFAEHVEKSMREGGELEPLREWAAKLPGNATRIAGLLHLWAEDSPLNSAISGQTMNAAITIAAILVDHARNAFGLMGADESIEGAKKILHWIQATHPETFTGRECLRAIRGSFPKMEQVLPALAILQDRGWIAEESGAAKTGPGRKPSTRYIITPKIFRG
jgi:hypothetical protein